MGQEGDQRRQGEGAGQDQKRDHGLHMGGAAKRVHAPKAADISHTGGCACPPRTFAFELEGQNHQEHSHMKIVIAMAVAAAALVGAATSADARPHHPHRVCTVRHHHRVCHMVR